MNKAVDNVLASLGLAASVQRVMRGPTVSRFTLKLSGRCHAAAVRRRADDIAIRCGASSVRVGIADGSLFIELPNAERDTVTLASVKRRTHGRYVLPCYLGLDAVGESLTLELADAPHLLIAGTTGSGKSVCVNSILCSLLLHHGPDSLRLLLVDPKRVELAGYDGLPHLLRPVVHDMGEAAKAIASLVDVMESRYSVLAERGARSIADVEGMPRIVCVVDELADLAMTHPGVMEPLIRIAQKGRAAGIHLVLATQRPEAAVVTGMLKANVTTRIAFRTASAVVDSRIILDATGAERLLGKGDGLASVGGSPDLVRFQGVWLPDADIERITGRWRRNGSPQAPLTASLSESGPRPGPSSGPATGVLRPRLYWAIRWPRSRAGRFVLWMFLLGALAAVMA